MGYQLDKISDDLINATISTEDKYFYKHIGFDYLRIGKAAITNIINRNKSEGASTITQQYARNLFLNFDKTWKRKIDEAILAGELEVHYTKKEILEGLPKHHKLWRCLRYRISIKILF